MSISEKLVTIAENEQKVFEAGKKSEYDEFWDSYQENGARTNYSYGFSGRGWTFDIFKPKYNITPTNGSGLFYVANSMRGDLTEILGNVGIVLDMSNLTNAQSMFYGTQFTRIGVLDFSKITTDVNAYALFAWSNFLQTVDKIILPKNRLTFANAFDGCTSLANIRFEGVIQYNLNMQQCPLTHESLISIINALGEGLSYTLTIGASNIAKLTEEEKDTINTKGWTLK